MKKYNLIPQEHPILHSVAPMVVYDQSVAILMEDMKGVMVREGGIGLAAPQIGVPARVIIVCSASGVPQGWCNPEIISSEGTLEFVEGCLSVPGQRILKKRSSWVTIHAQNEKGLFETFDVSGLEAVCFQHEIDHLNGILITD